MNRWRIELLGNLHLQLREQEISHFRTHKTASLLALMALNPSQPLRREEAIELVWPGEESESGRNRLRMALSSLRQSLERPEEGLPPVIQADRSVISLNPDSFTTDKAEFETLLTRARRATEDQERIALLTQAVDLYRGELLIGYDELWIMPERSQMEEAYLLALRRLIKSLALTHQYDLALTYVHRALATAPLQEELYKALMQLYLLTGRPQLAAKHFHQMERLFQTELNVAPSASIRQVYVQCQQRLAGTDDLSLPPATSKQESAAMSLAASPVLPLPLTPLFGRENDVEQIVEMLATPGVRLVTLIGMGGMGKTRLALEVARRLPGFEGRAWFVSVAEVGNAEILWEQLALVLQLPMASNRAEQIAQSLGSAPALLVLDSFEHLCPTGTSVVQNLLQSLPELTCLITSRQRLNLSGEFAYRVPLLPQPASSLSLEALTAQPCIALFANRVRAARPEFQWTQASIESAAAICRRLEGIPLAIELAAGWAQALTIPQIDARLKRGLAQLKSRLEDLAPRHRSLWAIMEESYRMLPDAVRPFFVGLSVFRGGWDLEAAEIVCAEPEALEYLLLLQERSLIVCQEEGDTMRYRYLDPLREFAWEQASKTEQTALAQAHADFFCQLAEQGNRGMTSGEDLPWLARLEQESANLCAALDWYIAAESAEMGLRLATALQQFWSIHDHMLEGRHYLSALLSLPQTGFPTKQRALALNALGAFAQYQLDYPAATAAFEECLEIMQACDDRRGIAMVLGNMGILSIAQDDLALAYERTESCLALCRELDNRRGTAISLSTLGSIRQRRGELSEARILIEESLQHWRVVKSTHGIANTLINLGLLDCLQDYFEEARVHLREGLLLIQELQNQQLTAYALEHCAILAMETDQPRRAVTLFGAAAALREQTGLFLAAPNQADRDGEAAELRLQIGEHDYHIAFQAGRLLTWEESLAYALETTLTPVSP